jgi:hypothetical protein
MWSGPAAPLSLIFRGKQTDAASSAQALDAGVGVHPVVEQTIFLATLFSSVKVKVTEPEAAIVLESAT